MLARHAGGLLRKLSAREFFVTAGAAVAAPLATKARPRSRAADKPVTLILP
jgi:hypothetical protein